MADFDPIVVTPPTKPVHDRELPRDVRFHVDSTGNLEYAEAIYDEYKDDGSMTVVRKSLRRYSDAAQFLTDFRANPKTSTRDWILAGTNEAPPEPAPEE